MKSFSWLPFIASLRMVGMEGCIIYDYSIFVLLWPNANSVRKLVTHKSCKMLVEHSM